MTTVSLQDAIRAIRSELESAVKEGVAANIRFIPKSVEVEMDLTFSLEAEAGGGFKLLSLIDLSGKAKTTSSNTHKVKLVMEPVDRAGKPTLIRDNSREPE